MKTTVHVPHQVGDQPSEKMAPAAKTSGEPMRSQLGDAAYAESIQRMKSQTVRQAPPPAISQSLQARIVSALQPMENQPPIQRVLVDNAGNRLSDHEVQTIIENNPARAQDITNAHNSPQSFTVRDARSGLIINPFTPPQTGGFHYSIPQGFSSTNGNQTNREAARSNGLPLTLGRQSFTSHFTQDLMQSAPQTYQGMEKIDSGQGLQQAGLDRTHHLSDSSIRIIVQELNQNRQWINGYGLNRVILWVQALLGETGNAQTIIQQFGDYDHPATENTLTQIAAALSNNTHQVGFGDSHTNQRVVGPFFDESRTKSGYPTPLSASIWMATRNLDTVVPKNIIDAALAQIQNDKTGELVTSMVVSSLDPFNKNNDKGPPPPPPGASGMVF